MEILKRSLIGKFSKLVVILTLIVCAACNKQQNYGTASLNLDSQKESTLQSLIERKQAFAPGTYAKGTIPEGVYIIVNNERGYYSESINGTTIENGHFDSFGYVYNNGVGNIEIPRSYLITPEGVSELGFQSAKALYETSTNQPNYNFSGYYLVGVDIPEGNYRIDSVGNAFVFIKNAPEGRAETLVSESFVGSRSITLQNGEYLDLSSGKIVAE